MTWLEVSVAVDQEAAESVAEVLAHYGYNGGVTIEALPGSDARPDDPGIPYPLESDPTYPVTLRTYLPLDERTEEQRQQIEQALWYLGRLRPIGTVQVRELAEEDWANNWKQFYSVQSIGQHTIIVPSWLDYTAQPDDVVLHLDPGMAFGTGLHPTTRLCLVLLEQYARPSARVLDLGTGSGILAIAAAKQGAAPVLALDNDTVAVRAAWENVERNRVQDVVTVAAGSLGVGLQIGIWQGGQPAINLQQPNQTAVQPPYDLIVANIIADVLVLLAYDLAAVLAPGGTLITSGIIASRAADVLGALEAAGLRLHEQQSEGDWVALVHHWT